MRVWCSSPSPVSRDARGPARHNTPRAFAARPAWSRAAPGPRQLVAPPSRAAQQELSLSSGSPLLLASSSPAPVSPDVFLGILVNGVPWAQLASWAAFAAFAFALRDFLGLAGCTFIISYLGNSAVSLGASRFPARRRALTVSFFVIVFLSCVGCGLVTLPSITREGADLVARIQAENPYALLGEKLRAALGDSLTAKLERLLSLVAVSSTSPPPEVMAYLSSLASEEATGATWGAERGAALGAMLQAALKQHTTAAVAATSKALAAASKLTLQAVLSLVLSFVIVWDLPALSAGVSSLRASRVGWAYVHIAPALSAFGALFGKALQAQFLVASVNTALTAGGMLFLQLPGVGFLTAIVFFCSFIPVAGVLISTLPIGFVALTEYGLGRLAAVVLMVVVAHAVEAYALNPAIYSAHLKLHPLLVLAVLVVAEHSLGVWGLLLAVPLTVFVVEYCIARRSELLSAQR